MTTQDYPFKWLDEIPKNFGICCPAARVYNQEVKQVYAKYGHPEDDYVAALSKSQEYGHYIMSFHCGEMPAFGGKIFDTLAEAKSWAKSELGITRWRGFDGQFVACPG